MERSLDASITYDLGVRSACSIASTAFVAIAAAMHSLQEDNLSASLISIEKTDVSNMKITSNSLAHRAHRSVQAHPAGMGRLNHQSRLQRTSYTYALPVDQARLKAITTLR